MRRRELFSGIVFLVFALIYTIASMPLAKGTVVKPGPGFFPTVLGCALMALSLVFLWQTYRKIEAEGGQLEPMIPRTALFVLIALAFFTLFLETLGYLLTAIIMMTALFRITKFKNWAWSIGTALVASFGSWLVFVHWLQVMMPAGILESFLDFLN